MYQRYLEDLIVNDALKEKKIAFITGPRQVGKTTLAQKILENFSSEENYYNWDDEEFKKVWAKNPKALIPGQKMSSYLVLDEIHKDRKWKNKLKGLYDLYKSSTHFMVTGSARLDYYRKSGDSLQGRYFPYRMHPFTFGESNFIKLPPQKDWEENQRGEVRFALNDLLNLSGFPGPLIGGSKNKALRWRRLFRERMIKEDLRDIQQVRDISTIDLLASLLTSRSGSQLSYASLRNDLGCSFESVLRWIDMLEAVYYCYRIRPYSTNIKNSLKKEPKLYFFDWTFNEDQGSRLENFIAGHLLKNVHLWTDMAQGEFDLFYIRDKQKREVDFLITENQKPYLLLEVKSNQANPTSSLVYYSNLLKPKFTIQLVSNPKKEVLKNLYYPEIKVMHIERFLKSLN